MFVIRLSFQKGFKEYFGATEDEVIPGKDINDSLFANGAVAYKAVENGEMIGGAVVVINSETQRNSLHLLYVKYGIQSKGIGKFIWDSIEKIHSETKVWETCTPYFDKRNIHFYVNKCGFHIVKYLREIEQEDFIGDGAQGMFEFEKIMKNN